MQSYFIFQKLFNYESYFQFKNYFEIFKDNQYLMTDKQALELEIIVYDYDTGKAFGEIVIGTDSTLSEVRKQIQGCWPKIGEFCFIKNQIEVGKASEQKQRLSKIVKNNNIYIQLKKDIKNEEQQTKTLKKDKMAECEATKAKIETLLKDVDAFAAQRKQKNNLSEAEAAKRIQNIQTKMEGFGIDMKFANTDTYLDEARNILKNNLADSDKFLQALQQQQDISELQMIKNSDKICKTYFLGKSCIARILDYDQLSYNVANSCVGGDNASLTFYSKEKSANFLKSYMDKNISGEVNVVGLTPFALIKAGFDACATQQLKEANNQQTQSQYCKTFIYSVHVGRGLTFSKDSIAIIKLVRDSYEKLAKRYFEGGNMEALKKDCLEFLKEYGFEMQVGKYSFGSTYLLENELFFNKKVKASQIDTVSASALNAALAGGFICQYGMMAGKGEIHSNLNNGSKQSSENLDVKYTTKKFVKADPNVDKLQNWKDLVTLNRGSWKVLGSQTKKVSLSSILRNSKNISPTLKSFQDQQRLIEFEKFFEQLYNEQFIKIDEKQNKSNQKDINIVLVGPTGAGKSYFGNQLIGRDIIEPFISKGSQVSQTLDVEIQRSGIYSFYDTPGLFDNRGFKSGEIPRRLSQIINKTSNSKDYKYINCFLLVVKVPDRVVFKGALEKIIQIFGETAMKSLILILNYPRELTDFSIDNIVQKVPDFKYFKEIYPGFDYNKQVFWNYSFDLSKHTLQNWFREYSNHRADILSRVRKLPIYTSQDYRMYQKVLEQREKELEQNQRKNQQLEAQKMRKHLEAIQKEKEEKVLRAEVMSFLQNLSYFTLMSRQSEYYIGYGNIANYLFYIPKGFNLFKQRQNLFLEIKQINYEQGIIKGYLGSQQRQQVRMSTDGEKQLGYRNPQVHTIQQVSIQFQDKKKGLVAFATMKNAYLSVKVSILGRYLFDNKRSLERANSNQSSGTSFTIRK